MKELLLKSWVCVFGMFCDDATKQLSFIRLSCIGLVGITFIQLWKAPTMDFPVNRMLYILTAYGLHKIASTYTINKTES